MDIARMMYLMEICHRLSQVFVFTISTSASVLVVLVMHMIVYAENKNSLRRILYVLSGVLVASVLLQVFVPSSRDIALAALQRIYEQELVVNERAMRLIQARAQ